MNGVQAYATNSVSNPGDVKVRWVPIEQWQCCIHAIQEVPFKDDEFQIICSVYYALNRSSDIVIQTAYNIRVCVKRWRAKKRKWQKRGDDQRGQLLAKPSSQEQGQAFSIFHDQDSGHWIRSAEGIYQEKDIRLENRRRI